MCADTIIHVFNLFLSSLYIHVPTMFFNTAVLSNDIQLIQCTRNLNVYTLIKMCYVRSDIIKFLVIVIFFSRYCNNHIKCTARSYHPHLFDDRSGEICSQIYREKYFFWAIGGIPSLANREITRWLALTLLTRKTSSDSYQISIKSKSSKDTHDRLKEMC